MRITPVVNPYAYTAVNPLGPSLSAMAWMWKGDAGACMCAWIENSAHWSSTVIDQNIFFASTGVFHCQADMTSSWYPDGRSRFAWAHIKISYSIQELFQNNISPVLFSRAFGRARASLWRPIKPYNMLGFTSLMLTGTSAKPVGGKLSKVYCGHVATETGTNSSCFSMDSQCMITWVFFDPASAVVHGALV